MILTTLDLHGMTYDEARDATIRFIESHFGTELELKIITGCSTRMKGVVLNVLEEYEMTCQISQMNLGIITTWMEENEYKTSHSDS